MLWANYTEPVHIVHSLRGGKLHRSLIDSFEPVLGAGLLRKHPTYSLHIVGHSLGGGIGGLLAHLAHNDAHVHSLLMPPALQGKSQCLNVELQMKCTRRQQAEMYFSAAG